MGRHSFWNAPLTSQPTENECTCFYFGEEYRTVHPNSYFMPHFSRVPTGVDGRSRSTDRPTTNGVRVVYCGTLERRNTAAMSRAVSDGYSNIIVVLQTRRSLRPPPTAFVRWQFHGQRLHSIETCVITLSVTDWLHNAPSVSSTRGYRTSF